MRDRRTAVARAVLALSIAATLIGLAATGSAEPSVYPGGTLAGDTATSATANTDDDVTHDW